MDGRWRGGGDGDGDGDDLPFNPRPGRVPEQELLTPELGFEEPAALWRLSGIIDELPGVFRSKGLSTLEGDSGTWPSRPPHRVARPRAHRAAPMGRAARCPPPSPLLAPWGSS